MSSVSSILLRALLGMGSSEWWAGRGGLNKYGSSSAYKGEDSNINLAYLYTYKRTVYIIRLTYYVYC